MKHQKGIYVDGHECPTSLNTVKRYSYPSYPTKSCTKYGAPQGTSRSEESRIFYGPEVRFRGKLPSSQRRSNPRARSGSTRRPDIHDSIYQPRIIEYEVGNCTLNKLTRCQLTSGQLQFCFMMNRPFKPTMPGLTAPTSQERGWHTSLRLHLCPPLLISTHFYTSTPCLIILLLLLSFVAPWLSSDPQCPTKI
jgi:hypothetical protein